jgi:hypothetical protein
MPVSENRDIPCLPYTFKTIFTSCYPLYTMLLVSHYPDILKCKLTKWTASAWTLNRKKLYSFNDVCMSVTVQGNQNKENQYAAAMSDLLVWLLQWWLLRIWDVPPCSLVKVQWPAGGMYNLCHRAEEGVCQAMQAVSSIHSEDYKAKPPWLTKKNKQTNSVALSLQANYTDWVTATFRQNLVPTFVDRGVSRGQHSGYPVVINLSFLDRSHYFSFK